MTIKVTKNISDAITTVREGGKCNMLDVECVIVTLQQLGLYEAVVWITDNPHTYAHAMFEGFKISGFSEEDTYVEG